MAFLLHTKIFLNNNIKIAEKINTTVRNLMSKQLVYNKFGNPVDVVKCKECEVPKLGPQDVLVRMLYAPINPADINAIQGKYPIHVTLPCIAGSEGVGVVEEVGKAVKGVSKGKKVIFTKSAQGTWRNYATFNQEVLRVVPDNLDIIRAATLTVNPCTAYRMLSDFQPVKNGGVVIIQNGANSACGQNVIQICNAWRVPNVNIVRNRPDIEALKEYLYSLGATYVLTEDEIKTTTIFTDGEIDKPKLALNCVGGKSSLEMLRHLDQSGCMVTYGGMSREPVTVPTSAFIFKNISFFGFWLTAWNDTATAHEKEEMIADVISLMSKQQLKPPIHKLVKIDKYQEAISSALTTTGFIGCKYILDFNS